MLKKLFKWNKKDKDDQRDQIESVDSLNEDKINENEFDDSNDDNNFVEETPIENEENEPTEVHKEESMSIDGVENLGKEEEDEKIGVFSRLKKGLSKTREGLTGKIDDILKNYRKIDEEFFEELEEILITADVGVNTTMQIIEDLEDKVKERKITDPKEIKNLLQEELIELLKDVKIDNSLNIEPSPAIILVVGVNGVGKTTTIGKLSAKLKGEGKKVLIAAGDTFRAAAIEQLQEWSNRAGVDIISHQEGADPAAVIFDGIQSAKARKADVLICDTAGRLHNKKNLMNELNKIFRVVEREYPNATKEVLLVVDATTGQNAIIQAKVFKEACDISGIVLTKLDGTAKGGVVLGVQSELDVPVKLVGVGEQINDLQEFNSENFIKAIFEE